MTLSVTSVEQRSQWEDLTDHADIVLERRALDAAMWGMPIVTVDAMRQAFLRDAAAVTSGDVVYWPKVSPTRSGIGESRPALYYAYVAFNTRKGPLVLEIPSRPGASLSGSLLDAWRMPQAEIGSAGEDGGNGARYLLLPPGYAGYLPSAYIPVSLGTHDGSLFIRSLAASPLREDTERALDLINRIAVYPLTGTSYSRHIDLAAKTGDDVSGERDVAWAPFWPGSAWIRTVPDAGPVAGVPWIFVRQESVAPVSQAGRPGPLHLFSMRDSRREPLNGSYTYRLRIPAGAPVTQFWCVTVYDFGTAGVIHESARGEINGRNPAMVQGPDGVIDVMFGAAKPCGRDVNWLPTIEERRWFAAFRLYGPEYRQLERSWRLPNIERVA